MMRSINYYMCDFDIILPFVVLKDIQYVFFSEKAA